MKVQTTILKYQRIDCSSDVFVYIWVDDFLNLQDAMSSFRHSGEDLGRAGRQVFLNTEILEGSFT